MCSSFTIVYNPLKSLETCFFAYYNTYDAVASTYLVWKLFRKPQNRISPHLFLSGEYSTHL